MSAKAENEKVHHDRRNSFPGHASVALIQCVSGESRWLQVEFGLGDNPSRECSRYMCLKCNETRASLYSIRHQCKSKL